MYAGNKLLLRKLAAFFVCRAAVAESIFGLDSSHLENNNNGLLYADNPFKSRIVLQA